MASARQLLSRRHIEEVLVVPDLVRRVILRDRSLGRKLHYCILRRRELVDDEVIFPTYILEITVKALSVYEHLLSEEEDISAISPCLAPLGGGKLPVQVIYMVEAP